MKKILFPSLAAFLLFAGCQAQPASNVQVPASPQPVSQGTTKMSLTINDPQAPTPTLETTTSLTINGTQEAASAPVTPSAGRMMKPSGDFHYDDAKSDYLGTLYLQGTVKVVEMSEGFCEENCKKFEYAFLNFDNEYDAGNADLGKFMEMNAGNSFAGGNAIGLGCVEEHGIRRMAFESGDMKEFTIGQTDSESILGATGDTKVLLKLTRPDTVPGMGAPDCYTHFTGIELVKFADNV
jgi:hypothetical protein